jgi:hypothetical protein
MLAAWILFKTQLDIIESMVRSLTDIVWTGSHRRRALSRGDVRVVYYGALGLVCLWGIFALRLAQPIMLLMLAANIAGMVFTIASIHLLYSTRACCRWSCAADVAPRDARRHVAFYGFFTVLSIRALI